MSEQLTVVTSRSSRAGGDCCYLGLLVTNMSSGAGGDPYVIWGWW